MDESSDRTEKLDDLPSISKILNRLALSFLAIVIIPVGFLVLRHNLQVREMEREYQEFDTVLANAMEPLNTEANRLAAGPVRVSSVTGKRDFSRILPAAPIPSRRIVVIPARNYDHAENMAAELADLASNEYSMRSIEVQSETDWRDRTELLDIHDMCVADCELLEIRLRDESQYRLRAGGHFHFVDVEVVDCHLYAFKCREIEENYAVVLESYGHP